MATTLVSGALPTFTVPQAVPPVYDASKGGAAVPILTDPTTAASKAFVQQQLAALPQTYAAQKAGAAANATLGLAGMGGYKVDAAGNLTYDASQAGTGQLERQAVQGQRASANARGTLYSSFTDTGIAQALGRLSQTAQGVVNQYADQLAGYLGTAATNATNLYGQWAGYMGQDAGFALANAPTGTAAPAPGPVTLPSYSTPSPSGPASPTALGKLPTVSTPPKVTNTLQTRFGPSPFQQWRF